jgi:hypothetical protein
MPAYVITGKLGAGKSLVAVSRIQHYILQGRKVATNVNLFPEHLTNNLWAKNCEIYRIPNKPTAADLNALPLGHDLDSPDDNRNGCLVLDECGTWFNSRSWNDKGRAEVIEWFRNARKKRWDIFFIIQDVAVMDSQARDSFAEHVVYCRRFDRFKIPLLHHFGIKPPKLHMGLVKYGSEATSPTVDRWMYRGEYLYDAYDTEQQFTANDEIQGLATVLPPYYTHGRYISKWEHFKNGIRNYKLGKWQFFLVGAFASTFAVNALVTFEAEEPKKGIWSCNDAYKQLFGSCDAKPVAPYEYYYPKPENAPPGQTGDGPKPEPEAQQNQIYIAGYEKTSRGVNMAFVTADGEPFYPKSYAVKKLGDCTAVVRIDKKILDLTCMPDSMAYAQPELPKDNGTGLLGGKAP